ncbi:HmuY family protein [Pseudochryseolinea flava]|uniref:HmuY protein n=1 Tax=Pseudochryseolinea flava TaxID=2059302 RepID=A0A364Y7I9_9BACT|nr:HmuY family protein [Pseudochryseolinea flava]RAW02357.1 hypothetical protein DQQ10_07435 [Pseudochryseolinea flava]
MKSQISFWKYMSAACAVTLVGFLTSCEDDDPPVADNVVEFEATELGFDETDDEITIRVDLSREVSGDENITLDVLSTGVTYDVEFVTVPAITGTKLSLPVTKGSTFASFVLKRKESVVLEDDDKIEFSLATVGEGFAVGERKKIVVSFSEIVATESTLDPTVGGSLQPNKVFIDLSANRQTSVGRGAWDFGFYTVEGQFRVILNSSAGMMARALDKNSLDAVTAEDTVGWISQLSTEAVFAALTSNPQPEWLPQSNQWIDSPTGDLSKAAIAEVSSTADENKVYIVNLGKNADGTQRGWKKIRVVRNGNNYTLQHADINATNFVTVEISRDADYHFNYVKIGEGVVNVEPKKDKWDIAFTVFTNTTPAGPGLIVPYVFQDIVLQNLYATETAELLTSAAGSYEDFEEADLASVTFSSSQINIGSKWRSGGGPGTPPALKEDRFYIVKDSGGNIYKLKFTALTQNGERGRPQIQFSLLKKGV